LEFGIYFIFLKNKFPIKNNFKKKGKDIKKPPKKLRLKFIPCTLREKI